MCGSYDDYFTVLYIELDNDDNVVDVGDSSGADSNSVNPLDIYKNGDTMYVVCRETDDPASKQYIRIYSVSSHPFSISHSLDIDGLEAIYDGFSLSQGIITNSKYYSILNFYTGPPTTPELEIWNYIFIDGSVGTKTDNYGTGNSFAFDGDDIIYLKIFHEDEAVYYLASYSITDDEITILSEINITLMLNRNIHGTNIPFNNEKGYASGKIYQIPTNYNGKLNLISSFDFTNTIKAITDHYVIDASGKLYEFVDVIAENYFSYLFLTYWKEDYPELDMEYRSDTLTLSKGQFIQVIGYLSADDQDRLFKGTYNFGDNEVDDEEDDIDFIDSYDLYDGECIIVDNWQNHKNVLRLQDDATAGEDPHIIHNETQATSGTREFWAGSNNINEGWAIIFREDADPIVQLRFKSNELQYYDRVAGYTTIINVSNNIWYHIKIQWFADNTFDVYVNGNLELDGEDTRNDMTSGINTLYIYCTGDSTAYFYLDAYGDVNNDSDYIEGDNQYIEEGGENQVVFEGICESPSGRKIQMCKAINQGSEMDEIEPSGEYTKDTDGLIDQLITDFNDYITAGTLQDGADLGTITLAGNKKERRIFNQCKDFDGYTFALRPQGELDYDDGSESTDVALLYEKDDHEDDPIWDVDTVEISSGTNQIIVKGAINPTTGQPYEDQYDDEEDQQQYGIHKIGIIDANMNSNAKCLTKATAIGTRELGGYLTVQCSFRKPLLGVIYPHQTITFKYISEDISISQATYIVDGIGVNLLREETFLQASTGLIFEYEAIEKELPEENAQKIEQNSDTIITKTTVYVSASNPTVNEDVDSGYLNGDLWINSGDAGVFILISNSSGAADWDELAKA